MDLLPINTPNAQELMEREAFEFGTSTFQSKGDELRVEIFDPVLDTYYMDVPAVWKGTVVTANDSVELAFDPPLALEMPKLAALGVGRSKFQLLVGIKADRERLVSTLRDTVNENLTIIDVTLRADAPPLDAGITGRIIGMAGDPCGGIGGGLYDTDWYVLERVGQAGMCIIHKGRIVYGGQIAYNERYGPSDYKDCERFARQNCPLSD